MKQTASNISHFMFFLSSLLASYFLGLSFYDSTTGLDYGKYISNVKFFLGEDIVLTDTNGSIYFYLISKNISTKIYQQSQEAMNIILNNSIQFTNFLLFFLGLMGLVFLFRKRGVNLNNILYSLSLLCFLPTGYYFRLTLKPEVLAFALFPWLIYFLDSFFIKKNYINTLISVLIFSTLLTIKASISGMILLCVMSIYRNEILKNYNFRILSTLIFVVTTVFTFISYQITQRWFFSQPISLDTANPDRWNNIASMSFFTNINFKNLLENPYQYIHSDSFISITLLDTLADYFRFFWQHQEDTNFISYGRIEFSDNFLLKTFLPQYISILFTFIFYSLVIYFYFKKIQNRELMTLPFIGILILIINSLGFPSKNFDPTTGDLFKVHYYSFLFGIAFFAIMTTIIAKHKILKFLSVFLIPIFLLSMGFPKDIPNETEKILYEKINNSEICYFIEILDNVNCKSS